MSLSNNRKCKFCGGEVSGLYELLDRHSRCVQELLLKNEIYPKAIEILSNAIPNRREVS